MIYDGWMADYGIIHVEFELDCKTVVDRLNSSGQDCPKVGVIIHECIYLLTQYQNPRVMFVKRQANIAAHTLAVR